MRDLTGLLADYAARIQFSDLPAATVEATKRSFLDALGVTLAAGTLGEGCAAFVDQARESGGRTESTVIGFGVKTSAAMAAFANGAMAHALDFEDAHDAALVHPNAPTVPAALAIAEAQGGVNGKELIAAIAVGCDLVCRLGLSLRTVLDDFGWYPPPILAAYGAATAAGRLLGLNAAQFRDAFSLVLCQSTCSAELKYSPNSVIRSVRDAFAAQAGVTAAQLAKRGVKGFDHPFEGKAGFFALYARGAYDPDTLVRDLGRKFAGEDISFKPWPSCRGTHAFVEGALNLTRAHGLSFRDVRSVQLRGHRLNRMLAEPVEQKKAPATAIDAKFSLPFTVATALKSGPLALRHFEPAGLREGDVLDLARRIDFAVDPTLSEDAKDITRGEIEIRTTGGAEYMARVDYPRGSPENPLELGELVAKFRDCAGYAPRRLSEAQIAVSAEAALNLERLSDIRDLPILSS